MYKIACNWSEELCDLITSGRADVDYIKTGAFGGGFEKFYDKMRAMKPVLIHGLGHYEMAGSKSLDAVDFPRAKRLLLENNCPHYGVHLSITNKDMTPDLREEDIAARMFERVQVFKKEIPVPLLLENIPDTPQEKVLYDHFPYSKPEQISKVICDNDVGFLLDITHAKITCVYREWNIHDYLRALPQERVKEIHVNGSGFDEHGFPDDTHNAMAEVDFELLSFVLKYTNPAVVTLEYVGIPTESRQEVSENLCVQLARLKKL
jgi:hypothetical protein